MCGASAPPPPAPAPPPPPDAGAPAVALVSGPTGLPAGSLARAAATDEGRRSTLGGGGQVGSAGGPQPKTLLGG